MIETERLLLRSWKEADVDEFTRINADPVVMEYFPTTHTKEETLAMVGRLNSHITKWGYGLFAAVEKSTSSFIGFIGLSHPRFENEFTPCVEIGWRLAKEVWNKGFATEGAKAVLDYAFYTLNLKEVYSWTAVPNTASERVMQKIDMHRVGYFDHPNLEKGHPLTPHVIYKIEKS